MGAMRNTLSAMFTDVLALLALTSLCPAAEYHDGRPKAKLCLEARDAGIVLRHGDGPGGCDALGIAVGPLSAETGMLLDAERPGTVVLSRGATGPKPRPRGELAAYLGGSSAERAASSARATRRLGRRRPHPRGPSEAAARSGIDCATLGPRSG